MVAFSICCVHSALSSSKSASVEFALTYFTLVHPARRRISVVNKIHAGMIDSFLGCLNRDLGSSTLVSLLEKSDNFFVILPKQAEVDQRI